MNSLLFLTFIDFTDPRSTGVATKIQSQVRVFSEGGFRTILLSARGDGLAVVESGREEMISTRGKYRIRHALCVKALEIAKREKIERLYVRFQFFSPDVVSMLRQMKSLGVTIVMELPTFPYRREVLKQGFVGAVKYAVDSLCRRFGVRHVDRFVTYTPFDRIYGVPAIITLNGIDVARVPVSNYRFGRDIHVIAVASMMPQHAYDRLLNGIGDYYGRGGGRDVTFHVVGVGAQLPRYRRLVRRRGIESHVLFHGHKSGDALTQVYDRCSIAVSALGMHRIGLHTASALKDREYAARGLAIIAATNLDFLRDDSPYYLRVASDESAIDMDGVVNFHDALSAIGDGLRWRIRRQAELKCDIRTTMASVVDFMASEPS